MTPLDESSQFQAYDRPSVVAGPFIDQYARGGFKVGVQRVDRWQATVWAGTEPALREAIFGGQFTLLHFPWPKWSAGVFYEEGLYNFYNDKRHSGGRAFLRYRFLRDVELPGRRPGVRRALLRHRQRVLGGRRRPAGQRLARRLRRPVPPEHALPLLGPGQGLADRGHGRVRQQGVRLEHRLHPRRRSSTGSSARCPTRLGPALEEPARLPRLRRLRLPRHRPALPARRRPTAPGARPDARTPAARSGSTTSSGGTRSGARSTATCSTTSSASAT